MANWKKVVVSGSNAELAQITASVGFNISSASYSSLTTPLVIDSDGNVTTGSKYALASGGTTVGGSSLTSNTVIVGTGNSGIAAASSTTDANFNSAQLYGIHSISSSGDLIFSSSTAQDDVFSISSLTGNTLNITSSNVSASGDVIAANLTDASLTQGQVVFADQNGKLKGDSDLVFSGDTLTATKITNVHSTTHITSSGNISASGDIIGNEFKVDTTTLAKLQGTELHIGANVNTVISASSLILSASGGITASVVPIDSPTHYLGQKANGEIVRVDVSTIGSGDGSSIVGVSEGTNIDITGGSSTTEFIKIFDRIFATTQGSPYGWENGGTVISGSDTASPNGGEGTKTSFFTSDIATTLQTSTAVVKLVHENGSSATQFVTASGFNESPGTDSTKWQLNIADAITFIEDDKYISVHLQVTTNTGNPVISLEDNVDIAGSASFAGNITASGNLYFSGSAGDVFQIHHNSGSDILNITASNAFFSGDVDAGSFSLNSIQLIANQVIITSGSNTFGSGSGNIHTFTGSLLVSGSVTIGGGGTLNIGSATLSETELGILDGASVTTAELNILDGVTATASELNILDGVTATTANLNILYGASLTTSELNILDGVTSTTAELNILDGVTSTAAELNLLDGVTSTTAELNILDGVTATTAELNTLDGAAATLTGTELNILDGATLSTSELNILDGVTATTSELNIMDGVTATTAELNLLDGVTATTAELNILDGVTSTASELNILDGVTSTASELNILDGVTATASELNILDGVTSTAAELNILDGVTSTSTELNLLDGVTATTTEINYLDGVTSAIQTQIDALADPSSATTFSDNVTIEGNLTVTGNTTTISSTELQIEDRFILIGSGSSTDNTANLGGNVDVGIIFETRQGVAGAKTPLGTALYHDASDDRLNVARGVPTNIGTNQIDTAGNGIQTGHVVTVRVTGSLGSILNTTVNKAAAGESGDVLFGAGEMVIDDNKDLWIYTA